MAGPYNAGQPASRTVLVNPDGTDYSAAGGGSGVSSAQVQGAIANDAPYSTVNPLLVGGYASSATPAAVATGDAVRAWYGLNGQAVTSIGTNTNGFDSVPNTFLLCSTPTNAFGYPLATVSLDYNGATFDRKRGDITGSWSKEPPLAKTDAGVTTATTTSAQLFAANATRAKLVIQNQDAVINVFVNIGATAVAGANNLRIAPGATLELAGTTGAVNIIAASGTPAICAWQF